MESVPHSRCSACKDGVVAPFQFSMAFQPILDVDRRSVYAYEALARGPQGEGAGTVLSQVNQVNRYAFDQTCRVKALTLAAQLNLAGNGAKLSINFMPGAVYSPAACLRLTLETAERVGFPTDQLIFEVTENEHLARPDHLRAIVAEYQRHGFRMAIDDFGAGHSGLNLLADLPVDIIKLDMDLTRNLHQRPRSMKMVRAIAGMAHDLGTITVAEGVESVEEMEAIRYCGVSLMQGYLFARPSFESLPAVNLPGEPASLPSCSAPEAVAVAA